jgi:serpin B
MVEENVPMLDAQAEFAIKLLQVVDTSSISTVISPISIVLALSLAYAGADGETRKEFDDAFAAGQSKEELHESFHKLIKFFSPETKKEYTLETANQVYFDSNFSIKDTYKQVVSQFYGGNFESLDFKKGAEVANHINSFVSDKTHDKIKDLISADAISVDTK